jgi:ribosome-associated protein
LELARSVVEVLEDKKGEDIVLMDIQELSDFADYFVICTGTSDRMLRALADGVIDQARERFRAKTRIEGEERDGWLLLDYGNLVVHLFSPDRRDYYRLEELWSQGKVLLRVQ